jgi:hypothetical protein
MTIVTFEHQAASFCDPLAGLAALSPAPKIFWRSYQASSEPACYWT